MSTEQKENQESEQNQKQDQQCDESDIAEEILTLDNKNLYSSRQKSFIDNLLGGFVPDEDDYQEIEDYLESKKNDGDGKPSPRFGGENKDKTASNSNNGSDGTKSDFSAFEQELLSEYEKLGYLDIDNFDTLLPLADNMAVKLAQ